MFVGLYSPLTNTERFGDRDNRHGLGIGSSSGCTSRAEESGGSPAVLFRFAPEVPVDEVTEPREPLPVSLHQTPFLLRLVMYQVPDGVVQAVPVPVVRKGPT